MELDKFEYEIRDVVLEAFGKQDSLTRQYLLELFDDDEPMAAAIVAVLQADGLVAEVGLSEQHYLPVLLVRKPAASAFLQNGGYTRQFEIALEKKHPGLQPDVEQQPNTVQQNVIIEERQPALQFNGVQSPNNHHSKTTEENFGPVTEPGELQKQYLALQKINQQQQQIIKERDEQIRLLKRKVKRLQYLKRVWWLAGFLLLIIMIMVYKSHVKVHH
ncbi:hypothetical protein HDF24_19020 [Mucilaginibacter sp. X4EP1]|uniref:hypothetical protein n=1 Tax=Mucilaginibacter sp. X4EP1 TaxID=2723092 RepID=UPI00216A88C1|nr:hypothetical protein [Mucilaginibacter sp. X4EP1]MCS3813333.1 hypothetical protein [Mucilaginibacter sp. X4EP1]